jgi:hypothetical protein
MKLSSILALVLGAFLVISFVAIPTCKPVPTTETNCSDGIDDDGDQFIDCDDYDCAPDKNCEMSKTTCADGQDNDADGYTDCDDFGCSFNCNVTACDSVKEEENTKAECSDGVDNDGDTFVDCDDWSCSRNVCGEVRALCAPVE